MRVLICDQESEMLETIARTFEVDVATSKATCIDLMRANPFDVLVASERLSDGSGLELLSHVATRWPDTLRVLVIEPARLKLLRGKLAPFRLDATLKYPVDEDELEAVLNRLYERIVSGGEEEEEPEPQQRAVPVPAPAATQTTKVQKVQLPQQSAKASSPAAATAKPGAAGKPAPSGRPTVSGKPAPSGTSSAGKPGAARSSQARPTSAPAGGDRRSSPLGSPRNEPTPVKRRLGNYTPLGSPEDEPMRIVEREFDHSAAPLASRAIRTREAAARPRTPAEKAKGLAAHLSNTLKRLLKR